MGIKEQKEKLRNRLLERRKAISEAEYNEASEEIIARLQMLSEFSQARTIHSYVSINKRREIDTHAFLRWLLASNKRVVVPITEFETTELRNVELHSFDDLQPNRWDVLEPTDGKEVLPSELDIVIVPMVGADNQCNRLGYGRGFYDRFLAKVDCPSVGLCFERCVIEELPTEPFDIQLSAVVTEQRIIGK